MRTALSTQDSTWCVELLFDPHRIKVEDIRYQYQSKKRDNLAELTRSSFQQSLVNLIRVQTVFKNLKLKTRVHHLKENIISFFFSFVIFSSPRLWEGFVPSDFPVAPNPYVQNHILNDLLSRFHFAQQVYLWYLMLRLKSSIRYGVHFRTSYVQKRLERS